MLFINFFVIKYCRFYLILSKNWNPPLKSFTLSFLATPSKNRNWGPVKPLFCKFGRSSNPSPLSFPSAEKEGVHYGKTLDDLTVSCLERLAHHGNVASLILLYGCYCGRCLFWLAELVPPSHSNSRCTSYSNRLHDFSAIISRCSRCYKNFYVNCYFLAQLDCWIHCLERMFFFDL